MNSENKQPQTIATNISRVADLIRGVPICMLTTVMGDGTPHARPMMAQEQAFDGHLWFVVERESPLSEDIRRNPHVGVTFADTITNRYVSVSGSARVIEDRAVIATIWRASMEAWFPGGPLDPAIALVRVDPAVAWFWEGAPASLGSVLDLAKAVVSGEGGNPQPGASGRLQL